MLPVICLYLVRASDEEKMMIEKFGDGFRESIIKTGRGAKVEHFKGSP